MASVARRKKNLDLRSLSLVCIRLFRRDDGAPGVVVVVVVVFLLSRVLNISFSSSFVGKREDF
jgi:hypothetical protein